MEAERTLQDEELTGLADLAAQLRVDSIRCSTRAGSGHPTSSLSAADLLAVLVARHLRYDWSYPGNRANDHLIFSKGHASPLLYSVFRATGAISEQELLDCYRQSGSRLQGHPTPVLPWVDVATGSLGQGLPVGVGIALAGQYLDRVPFHVWVLCGDSETAEGSIWEALDKAGHFGLRNLTAIVDVNRFGQRGPTELEWDLDTYRRRVEAFGCHPIVVDGHDLAAIDDAFGRAREATGPTVVLARTVKGKGVPEIENRPDWHGKALEPDQAERAVQALGGVRKIRVAGPRPAAAPPAPAPAEERPELPRYEKGAKVATRNAYGDALRALGVRRDVVVLDGEVADSTRSDKFGEAYPDRFFEMFIAEQQLIAAAVGLRVRGYRPFAATFAAFLSRAYDFIRMAGISRADIALAGSHAGVEIGPDGPSQMGLEDLAALRAVHGSTVLYPSDAVSCAALVAAMVDCTGVSYLRTTRGKYPVLYDNGDEFPIGGSKLVRDGTDVTLIGAGVTVHNCLAAAEELAREGIDARVIDLYSVKPVDRKRLLEAVRDTGGRLVVVEDHYPQGGLGSAVLEELAGLAEPVRITHLAVRGLPGSGTPTQQMDMAGIGPHAIVSAARALA
ncbi:transketolase [Micromonospora terminaliae]|uniref:Transketolase n=1 Tax=Micromonospora terminaliae TaxID=1914461 RepID=A0AAJ2ZLQ3_9ACTN|nr:transketolase [Micromonospora terminaliae]NES31986.1 transketolase [Micromonospora terminaliae]QGL51352.1 transketolase [Micromonospora terminaliae]